jgi:hypothetical protein
MGDAMRDEEAMSDLTAMGNGYVPIDLDRLPDLEAVIERGRATFMEVGRALSEIRDGRLYAADYRTFEDYCAQRWGLRRSYAYEIIQSAQAAQLVSGTPDTPAPQTARVAAELAPLREHPDRLREAWSEAVEQHGPQPTAAQVRETVRGASGPASRTDLVLKLADGQRDWTVKLRRYIERELGDDPLPGHVRRQIAVGALQRAHAAVTVLQALVDGEPPDLDVLDTAPKFAREDLSDV